jgi:DNA-binding LytR/AlgR family response regulator
MAQLESQLDTTQFARVHRSHLVNIGRIASIEPLESGDARVHLRDGAIVACSRRYRESLKGSINH